MTTAAPPTVSHASIFRRYWRSISGTFAMLTLENALGVFEPLLLGVAINRLIAADWIGLVWLALLELAIVIVGVARRLYDTRVYTRIFSEIGSEVVAREQARGTPITQVNARADLMKEVIDFFETMLPLAITAGFVLIGSLVMIAWLDFRVFVATLAAALATALVFFLARRHIHTFNRALNDQIERQVAIFESMKASSRERHFRRLAIWRIRLSDLDSLTFGLTYVFLIAALLFGVYDAITRLDAEVGTVFALITYLFQFTESVIALPITYQQSIRTAEIAGRVAS